MGGMGERAAGRHLKAGRKPGDSRRGDQTRRAGGAAAARFSATFFNNQERLRPESARNEQAPLILPILAREYP